MLAVIAYISSRGICGEGAFGATEKSGDLCGASRHEFSIPFLKKIKGFQ